MKLHETCCSLALAILVSLAQIAATSQGTMRSANATGTGHVQADSQGQATNRVVADSEGERNRMVRPESRQTPRIQARNEIAQKLTVK